VWNVVLPTARSGLVTAVILGTARGIGETSPVLLTAGFTASLNTNPLDGPMVSLPLAAFDFIKSPEENFKLRGFAATAVLLTLVLILFIIARLIGGRGPGQLSPRQARARARQSARDAKRFAARESSRAEVVAASPPGHRDGGVPS
jgi:phosphate transport system permease protein